MVIEATRAFREGHTFRLGEVSVMFEDGEAVVAGPEGRDEAIELPADGDVVRAFVREDARGRYRPLTGARGLRGGWRVRCSSGGELGDVLEAIYPLALCHRAMAARGDLRTAGLDDVLARQSGRYRVAGAISEEGRETARATLCGRCVRAPVWAGVDAGEEGIPCPEPCSVLVALCREAALWEDEAPESAPVDPDVAFAAFEKPGNEVRESYLAAVAERAHSR